MNRPWDLDEPSAADLDAIEAEWPVIAAELGVLDAEIAALAHDGGPSALEWRRVRRARRQLLATIGRHADDRAAPRQTWGQIFRENPAHPTSDAMVAFRSGHGAA
jgi:hypothetical protein